MRFQGPSSAHLCLRELIRRSVGSLLYGSTPYPGQLQRGHDVAVLNSDDEVVGRVANNLRARNFVTFDVFLRDSIASCNTDRIVSEQQNESLQIASSCASQSVLTAPRRQPNRRRERCQHFRGAR